MPCDDLDIICEMPERTDFDEKIVIWENLYEYDLDQTCVERTLHTLFTQSEVVILLIACD